MGGRASSSSSSIACKKKCFLSLIPNENKRTTMAPHTPPSFAFFALLLFCFPKQEQHLSQRGFDLVKWGFVLGE
jgi:hypothetical protein